MKNTAEISYYVREIALNNSQIALKELYTCYFYDLLHYSMIYVNNSHDAEEVISDTFLSVWENRKKLLEISNFNSYIYTIVRNKSISQFRSMHIENQSIDTIPIDIFAYTDITPENELISKEKIAEINSAINSLPNKCKIAFKLVKENNLKYREVAEILNISVKTLEAHLATALKKIRESLETGDEKRKSVIGL